MEMDHEGKLVAPSATGMYPESKAICPVVLVNDNDLHGTSKELCVTVWFFCLNSNVTVSPRVALMLFGEYTNPADPPTVTLISRPADDDGAAEALVELPLGAGGAAPPVAAALNRGKSEPGLTAKTMPAAEQ